MNLKILLLLLAVLIILFFAGVGAGFLGEDNLAALEIEDGEIRQPAWLGRIDSLFPKGTATFDDILGSNDDAACLDSQERRLTVPANLPCWYTLANAAGPRTLTIELVVGAAARVEVHQPVKENGSMGMRETLASRDSVEFDLFRRQSENDLVQLRVSCLGLPGGCVLQILE